MKKSILILLLTSYSLVQGQETKSIQKEITTKEAKEHLTYLASNELEGRNTGSEGIEKAGMYIQQYYKKCGLKPAASNSYFQEFSLLEITPPNKIELTLADTTFHEVSDLLLLSGTKDISYEGDVVFVGFGSKEDLSGKNVKGKVVVAYVGTKDNPDLINALLVESPAKREMFTSLGAVALVEVIITPGVPFQALANYLNKPRMTVDDGEVGIGHLWMKNTEVSAYVDLKKNGSASGTLAMEGVQATKVPARNVAGILEGSDKKLKNEFLVVSAHYDHVGIGAPDAQGDTIYNGARDNALGTVGLMLTAKYLSKYKPKRSVLFLAFTAEEKGLLGSEYYSKNPLVPMKNTVFNFNCDGAGYNDTTVVTVIGLERTTAEANLAKACESFGLKAELDPVPEQNLFERSDNYNFAKMGVPAITFAPGTKAFDEELLKYYHQPADEVGSLNFNYLTKYYRAYVYANLLLANMDRVPYWVEGDKFKPVGDELYK